MRFHADIERDVGVTHGASASPSRGNPLLRRLVWFATPPAIAGAFAALWFVHPAAAFGFLAFSGALVWGAKRRRWPAIAPVAASALVVAGWLALPARNDRTWEPDVAAMAWADIEGDTVMLHNHRNFDWRTEHDFTPRWETKTLRLSQLVGLDFIMSYWGSPHICHTMVSFDFGPGGRVCVSIEARRERGEEYSALGGMFRRYELIYVLGEERDLVHLRTNVRPHDEVYLFRLNAKPEIVQAMFLDYLRSASALRERPAWYHTLVTNCSTTIREHVRRAYVPDPWDWRVLANGHADERLYELGYISRELPLPELKRRSRLRPISPASDSATDFSTRIRAGLPGF